MPSTMELLKQRLSSEIQKKPRARILFVKATANKVELARGRILCGYPGELFGEVLNKSNLPPLDCYFTTFDKTWISSTFANLSKDDLLELLTYEIASLPQLTTIILQGREVFNPSDLKGTNYGRFLLKHFTDKDSLANWRGSMLSTPLATAKVIPTYDQDEIYYSDYKMKNILLVDLKRAAKYIASSAIPTPEYNFIYPTSYMTIIDFLKQYRGTLSAVDTETYPNPLRISCMSIAINGKDVLSIPFERNGRPIWQPYQEVEIMRELNTFLKATPTIMQNAMYDLFVFAWRGYTVPAENLWMDTMLAHAAIYLEYPHGLDFLTSIYTEQSYYKDEGKSWHPSFNYQQLIRYNCLDSAVTYDVALALDRELKELNYWEFYKTQYLELLQPFCKASLDGMCVSFGIQEKLLRQYRIMQRLLKLKINEIAGEDLNVNSPLQVKKFLYETLKLPPQFKTRKKKDGSKEQGLTADESSLKKLMLHSGDDRLQQLINLRKVTKVIGTYLQPRLDDDKRIRYSFDLKGTNTGRISEYSSPTGSGMSLHNLPRGDLKVQLDGFLYTLGAVKGIFVADPDYVLLIPDYKQAELFIVAMLAHEEKLLNLLISGKDVHRTVASELIYHVPFEEVTDIQRYLSKRTVHASDYGMSWIKLQEILYKEDIYLEAAEVKRMGASYHSGFPNIRGVFQKNIEETVKKTRMLVNPFGRIRYFFGALNDDTFRSAYAAYPQGTVADLLNRAAVKVSKRYKLIGQQHDSMWVLVRLDEVDTAVPWIWEQMRIPITVEGYTIEIPADMKYGISMGNMRDYNPKTGADMEWLETENAINKKNLISPSETRC